MRIRGNINLKGVGHHPHALYMYILSESAHIPHCASSIYPPVREGWETVPNSEAGKSCRQEHVTTHPGLGGTPHTCGQPLPTAPPGVEFCLPAGPWLSLLLACPGLRELCGRDKGSEQPQECDAGLRSGPGSLATPEAHTHGSLLLQTTEGKTTTTAGLGPSPNLVSRPQCYQHRGAMVFVGCHGTTQQPFRGQITLPHIPGTKRRAKALLTPT